METVDNLPAASSFLSCDSFSSILPSMSRSILSKVLWAFSKSSAAIS
jgi:hypothetical protein